MTVEEKFIELGFYPLYIRDVPMGCVLNAETANTFLLINSGSFINIENIQITPSYASFEMFILLPPSNEAKYYEQLIFNGEKSLNEIIDYFKKNKNEKI